MEPWNYGINYFCIMPAFSDEIMPVDGFLPDAPGPVVIAGPCSAESEEQVLETARELARLPQVFAFRCGLWKPRTRPGDFEGVGNTGLDWLRRVQKETGLKTAVEVATPAHVHACLEVGVDILWIGSRTVVNPFSVHEIADALKGTDIPVLVKNPVNPDLRLWIGALERLHHQGIRKLAAVHRGFSAFGSHPYRNLPLWEIPIELRRLWPGLPVLTDPSHIAGNRGLIPQIMQTSADLAFNGLMIEAHHRPEMARTDREQQVTPAELAKLLDGLSLPRHSSSTEDIILKNIREEIDRADEEILRLLALRMETAERAGKRKRELGLDLLQLERWKMVVEDRLQKGATRGLHREFLLKILQDIHEEALRRQNEHQDHSD